MSFTSTAASLATVGAPGVETPAPAWAYGLTAFACFMVLLGVLWCFRNTAVKYDTPAPVHAARQADAHRQGPHGATDHGAHR